MREGCPKSLDETPFGYIGGGFPQKAKKINGKAPHLSVLS